MPDSQQCAGGARSSMETGLPRLLSLSIRIRAILSAAAKHSCLTHMIRTDYKEFARLSRSATLVPVVKSISADLLTPVSAFLAVADGEPDAFFLESAEGGEKIGRYTFLGVRPFLRLESRAAEITIERGSKV